MLDISSNYYTYFFILNIAIINGILVFVESGDRVHERLYWICIPILAGKIPEWFVMRCQSNDGYRSTLLSIIYNQLTNNLPTLEYNT